MTWKLEALCAGRSIPFKGNDTSAIAKQAVEGKTAITRLGIAGDEQADKVHHGGPDMALHHYPREHHHFWQEKLAGHDLLALPGAFGTNLSVRGLTESEVLLGDRFRLGTALLEACQPRKPCWKIEHRFGRKGMVKAILATRRCGWFYRVIEEGEAQAGDALIRESRGTPRWSMERIFETLWGTSEPTDRPAIEELAETPLVPAKLRAGMGEWLAANP